MTNSIHSEKNLQQLAKGYGPACASVTNITGPRARSETRFQGMSKPVLPQINKNCITHEEMLESVDRKYFYFDKTSRTWHLS